MPERRPIVNPAAQAEHVDTDTLNVGQGPVFAEQASSLGTPSSGTGVAYAKTDGKLYFKNDAGTEYDLTATGGGGGGGTPVVTVFNASGTYTNSQTGFMRVILIGGAAGGGSGRRGAAGSARYGGGSGSTAGYTVQTFMAADLPASINVYVGAGGLGGAAQTVDNTNGLPGGGGGVTLFGGNGSSSDINVLASASAGGFASGGTNASQGTTQSTSNHLEGFVAIATSAGYPPNNFNGGAVGNQSRNNQVGTAGGLGGGIDTANTRFNGGTGDRSVGTEFGNPVYITGSAGGAAIGANGANGTVIYGRRGMYLLSTGGGGGAAGDTAGTIAGGRGGNGGIGSSGGGGGASTNGANSGAGGNGGGGLVVVIHWS